MKNLQTRILKFSFFVILFFGTTISYSKGNNISTADSLFRLKLYTQSFEIYQALLSSGHYSPAMLLKMAYIQEGLNHVGQSMYYLRLYQHATDDPQATDKMRELAEKHNLSGYDENDASLFYRWINKNLLLLEAILAGIVFLMSLSVFQLKRKKKSYAFASVATCVIVIVILFLNNFVSIPSVITNGEKIYLMEGPSSGSSVAGIVGDGNQLQVVGKEDVWLKVKWNDKNVFVKDSNVLQVIL